MRGREYSNRLGGRFAAGKPMAEQRRVNPSANQNSGVQWAPRPVTPCKKRWIARYDNDKRVPANSRAIDRRKSPERWPTPVFNAATFEAVDTVVDGTGRLRNADLTHRSSPAVTAGNELEQEAQELSHNWARFQSVFAGEELHWRIDAAVLIHKGAARRCLHAWVSDPRASWGSDPRQDCSGPAAHTNNEPSRKSHDPAIREAGHNAPSPADATSFPLTKAPRVRLDSFQLGLALTFSLRYLHTRATLRPCSERVAIGSNATN